MTIIEYDKKVSDILKLIRNIKGYKLFLILEFRVLR